MRALHIEAGQRFGKLIVVDPAARKQMPGFPCGRRVALCRCDCGTLATIFPSALLRQDGTRSCGRCRREALTERNSSHGLTGHPLYGIHLGMMHRCYHESHQAFHNYGGRSVTVCARWHDVRLFIDDILREIGPRPASKSLDRIDNDGNYEPGNVRWATPKEQAANKRRKP